MVELAEVLRALRAGWWLPVVGLVVGGAAALLVSLLQTPLYTSSTQLFVSTRDSASTSDAFQGSQFTQQRVASYERLLAGDRLLSRVIERLDLDLSADQLARQVTAKAVPNTVLLDVTVTDPSPERAQDIAREIARTFSDVVADLETPTGADSGPVKVGRHARYRARQSGYLFPFSPEVGDRYLLRGSVEFQWRRRGRVVRRVRELTSDGHADAVTVADPKGYSAATCEILG